MRGRRRFSPVAFAVAFAVAFLAGCAHAPRIGEPVERVSQRFEGARASREAMLSALTGEWMLRVDAQGAGKLPALPAVIQLSAPDRARLKVSALIGVALDVLAANDSLYAWMPSRRLAFAAPGEQVGVGAPAAFVGRVLAATWAPPASAWSASGRDSAGWRLGWREGSDSLRLVVDDEGKPLEAWFGREERGVRVRYSGWMSVRGEPFPQRCELDDDSGYAHVRLVASDVEAAERADAGWFTPRRVEGWKTMDWDELKSLIARKLAP